MTLSAAEMVLARRWLVLAVMSLVLAGGLAVLLVVGRMPPFDRLVGDPLFFKRCLVLHVDLSLVVWFYAFLGALFFTLPGKSHAPLASVGHGVAVLGVVALLLSATRSGARPLLSNYIAGIDHPLFLGGLALFGAGLGSSFLDRRLLPGGERAVGPAGLPAACRPGLRAAAIAVLLALLTAGAAVIGTPAGLEAEARYELLFWGAGHVLQFASVAAMITCWIWLVARATGESPIRRDHSAILFALLLLPVLPAPLLAAQDTTAAFYRAGFTRIMQFGIFPVTLVFLGLLVSALRRARARGQLSFTDLGFVTFAASAGLTLLGFVLGALIRGSNTMVPAHYHASIGAVTAAFMGVTYLLLERMGLRMPGGLLGRLSRVQPLAFGIGQSVFALGFGLAGQAGMARKVYGAEQAGRGVIETIGLGVMGTGGLIAVAGGLLFLAIVLVALGRPVIVPRISAYGGAHARTT